MDLLKDVCRLCLSVSENMESLFDNEEVRDKISSALKVELLQVECLPEGICTTCKAIIDHIHSFHQKVIKSQEMLNLKLKEGTDSLRDFFHTFKDIKDVKQEIVDYSHETEKMDKEDDVLKLDEMKCELENKGNESENELSNSQGTKRKYIKKVTHITSKSNRRKKKIEIELLDNVLNDDIKMEEETCSSIKQEESDFDIDLAMQSASEDDDWMPQINIKRKATSRKRINDLGTENCNGKTKKTKRKANENKEIGAEKREVDRTMVKNDQSAIKTNTEDKNNSCPQSWKCLTCFEIFADRKLLSNHFTTKHIPKMDASQDLNLNNYSIIEENGKKMCKCGYCGKVNRKKYISKHISVVHNKIRPYVCNMCGRTFQFVTDIVNHNRAHGGKQIFCSYNCGYMSTYPAAVKEHEMRKHREEFKYKCECGKNFNVRTWYEDHQNEHKGVKPYVCRFCKQAFYYEKQLNEHSRRKHSNQNHTPTEKCIFTCTLCALGFANKIALKNHLFEEHGIKKKIKYLCDDCGKSYTNSSHLKSHKLHVHSGLRPHTCSQCNKSFKKKSHLTRHEETHLKKWPPGRRRPGRKSAIRQAADS